MTFPAVIRMRDPDPVGLVIRVKLVSHKIMEQPFNDAFGQLRDISKMSIHQVVLQYGDDLVVSFIVVQHPEAANRHTLKDEVVMRDGLFTQNTNIEWITIP